MRPVIARDETKLSFFRPYKRKKNQNLFSTCGVLSLFFQNCQELCLSLCLFLKLFFYSLSSFFSNRVRCDVVSGEKGVRVGRAGGIEGRRGKGGCRM